MDEAAAEIDDNEYDDLEGFGAMQDVDGEEYDDASDDEAMEESWELRERTEWERYENERAERERYEHMEGMLRDGIVEGFDWTPERIRLAEQILAKMELPELVLKESYFDANQGTFLHLMRLLAAKPEFKRLCIEWEFESRMVFIENLVVTFPPQRLDCLKLSLFDEWVLEGALANIANRETLARLVQIPSTYFEFLHIELYLMHCLPSLRACLAAFDQGVRCLREEEGEDGPYIKTEHPVDVCDVDPDSHLAVACREYDVLSHLDFSVLTQSGIASLSTVASLRRPKSLILYYCVEEPPTMGNDPFGPFRRALAANKTLEELTCKSRGRELDFITQGVLPALHSNNGSIKNLEIEIHWWDEESHDCILSFCHCLQESLPLFKGLESITIRLSGHESEIDAVTKNVLTEAIKTSLRAGLQQNTSITHSARFYSFEHVYSFPEFVLRNWFLQSVHEFVPPSDNTEQLLNSFVTMLCSIVAGGQVWDDGVYLSPVVELVRRWLPQISSSRPSFWENTQLPPAASAAAAAAAAEAAAPSAGRAEASNVAARAKRSAQEQLGDLRTRLFRG